MPLNRSLIVSLSAFSVVTGVTLGTPRTALAADKKQECARAYEQSQELRANSKLRAARDALVICAQDACPAFVQSDCTTWLVELHREMPTVVVAATDNKGNDIAGVKTTMDGQPLEFEHEGKAVAIDPGRHQFHFELEGYPAVDREIVIRQGEKDRILTVTFSSGGDSVTPVDPQPVAPPPQQSIEPEPVTSNQPGPLRPYAFVAAGVGVVGLAGFTVLGLMGKSQRSDIEDSGCSPNCSKDEVDSVKTKLILADVSLGIGIAGLGTAVALWFLSEPKKTERAAGAPLYFDVKPTTGGGYASVAGRF